MTTRLSTGLQNALAGINRELVTNGDFATAATSWTAATATVAHASGAVDSRTNTLKVNGSAGYAHQSVTVKPSQVYRLTFRNYNSAGNGYVNVGLTAGTSANYASGNTANTAWATAFTPSNALVVSGLATAYFKTTSAQTAAVIQLGTDGTGDHHYDDISLVCMSRSIQDVFTLGNVKIYTGTQPTDPDDAPTGTLLVTINNGGTGITFGDAADGVLSKTVGETWSGVGADTGTAGYFRLCAYADLGTDNGTDCRIDGTVATSGGELNFGSLAFTSGATQTISDLHPTVQISA